MRGTTYAAAEIALWILAAALIGAAIGWILRGWRRDVDEDHELRTVVRAQHQRLGELQAALDARSTPQPETAQPETSQPETPPSEMTQPETIKPEEPAASVPAVEMPEAIELDLTETEPPAPQPVAPPLVASDGDEEQPADEIVITDTGPTGDTESELAETQNPIVTPLPSTVDSDAQEGTPSDDQPALVEAVSEQDQAVARVTEIAARTRGEDDDRDDLTRIHGVGPKLAGLLNSMGISSFLQVSQFSREDIESVTAALQAFPGRIERDDWVGSATELYATTHGGARDMSPDPWG